MIGDGLARWRGALTNDSLQHKMSSPPPRNCGAPSLTGASRQHAEGHSRLGQQSTLALHPQSGAFSLSDGLLELLPVAVANRPPQPRHDEGPSPGRPVLPVAGLLKLFDDRKGSLHLPCVEQGGIGQTNGTAQSRLLPASALAAAAAAASVAIHAAMSSSCVSKSFAPSVPAHILGCHALLSS
eukprot:CAMPEP_0115754184 /NCGR_PEP_ID=MMETSP0272-20121206/96732_1 /TAXON_ID=71861 /ORGANISM="Scrippsiella trochoidea, Strain CCMP3099" /LENGTH=182 /DNA_ID=CAMNT_0003199569 /DNA_START=97 /DNA_END=646 /DNA_ORIENTATION=-